jgi:hypothetical protein
LLVIGCVIVSDRFDAPARRALARRLDPRGRRGDRSPMAEPATMTAP